MARLKCSARTVVALITGSIAAVAVGGLSFPGSGTVMAEGVIGDPISLVLFTRHDHPTGSAMVEVPFTEDLEGAVTFTVSFDLDRDGVFTAEEIAVDHVSAPARTEFPSAFPVLFSRSKRLEDLEPLTSEHDVPVRVVIEDLPGGGTGALVKETEVERATFEIAGAFHPPPVGFTGGGPFDNAGAAIIEFVVPPARAGGGDVNVHNDGVPDLKPRKKKPNECFPLASANSLLWLAKKHKFEDKMPATSDDLADELDGDVGWTKKGTEDAKMVDGKDAFARRHGIPLVNKKIDNEVTDGQSNLWDKIVSELQDGEDVELIIKKKETAVAKGTAGHAVTVVGANSKKGKKYVTVHDVLTREGNDTYEVGRDGRLIGYSALGGKYFVEFIISESFQQE